MPDARNRALTASLLLLIGCRVSAPQSELPHAWHTTISGVGTWQVRWYGEQDPLPFREPCALQVEVSRCDGAPVPQDLELRVDAGMPAHGHGTPRRSQVSALGSGRFRVEGLYLPMPGAWSLYLDVGHEGVFERAQFEFEVD